METNTFNFQNPDSKVNFVNCDFDNSTFNDRSRANFEDSARGKSLRFGSIFGEGSLTMVVSMTALVISVACLSVTISSRKKKVTAASDHEES